MAIGPPGARGRRAPWARPVVVAIAAAAAIAVAIAVGGCFGDWVSAVPRPRREAPAADPEPAASAEPEPPAEPCAAYLAEVARRCDAVFDGHLGPARCHAQIIRVMNVFHPDRAPEEPGSRASDRDRTCTRYLRALPAATPSTREPAALGPSCRAWAEQLRERCVAPLSTMPPRLERCGASLLAFESMLGGIVFGRPSAYEPRCEREVQRSGPHAGDPQGESG